jgi:exodeoxyribonuclease V gamma subunit
MTLTIQSSNRVETLQACLAQRLANAPPADPFAREQIVVPTFAMARWLNLRLAQSHGVAANIDYPQPAAWVWRLAQDLLDDLPRQDPFSREAVGWRVYALLPGLLEQDAFGVLRDYLADDRNGIKRWQLAQRIAEGFDRYLSYRPHLIRDWSSGGDGHWQARLWRALLADRGQQHRVAVLARLIDRLRQPGAELRLPSRVSLFCLSTLPELYLEVVRELAARVDLQMYLHCPSDQYWADLESEKRKSRRQLSQPGQGDLFDAGNELLASWGRLGQVFQDQLLEQGADGATDIDLFSAPDGDSLLEQLQRSIFSLEAKPVLQLSDDSIGLHVCHSAMRECEVLRDRLLDTLESDPTLNPEDILVMIPDIAGYAPYIEAVFQQQAVPFNVSDISLADEHPLVMTFLQLLELPGSRFTQSEILSLLDNEALQLRFEFDAEALAQIHRLVEQGHTRWGIDAEHKANLDLPATPGNTWQQLGERFFAGFALAGDELWRGISPLAAADEAAGVAIGRFWHFLDRLNLWRERLATARGAGQWQSLLMQLLDDFFVESDPRESRLQQIRDAISQIGAAGDSEISAELLAYLMQRLLKSSEQSGQLYSGGITFCGMHPMRSIPFRVICLLGMNHGDFPRRDPPSDFEIIAAEPRYGDPSRRLEDRYLMLETLLCARQKLYLSYTGRSLKDNSEIQPSALVQELLDFIDSHFDAGGETTRPSAALTRVHPMQAFSADNYRAGEFSYSGYWCAVARRIGTGGETAPRPWPRQALAASEHGESIDVAQLRRFVTDPVQYFFRQRLGIYLQGEDLTDDDEPFELSALDTWQIKARLTNDRLAGRSDGIERLRAEGLLAHGHAADSQVESIRDDLAGSLQVIDEYSGIAKQSLAVKIEFDDDSRLEGSVVDFYPGKGLMVCHPGKFRGRYLLALWIDHLAICAGGAASEADFPSLLIAEDKRWRIPAIAAADARAQLADYCALYRRGLELPLPVFPQASYDRARAKDRDQAVQSAMRAWQNSRAAGDNTNAYLKLALQAGYRLPFDDPDFDAYAARLYARLLDEASDR